MGAHIASRLVAVTAAAVASLGAVSTTWANDNPPGIDLGGATIEIEVQLPNGDGGFAPQSAEDTRRFFNRANCLCPSEQFGLEFTLQNPPGSLDSQPVDVWFGSQCDSVDPTIRDANCTLVHTFGDVEDLRTPDKVGFSVEDLAGSCEPNNRERNAYALIDESDDGIDTAQGDYVGGPLGILVDTQPPPAPEDIETSGAEQAIAVSWKLPSSRADDLEYVQILCARADGTTDKADKFPRDLTTRYLTADAACGTADPTTCPLGGDGDPPDLADGGTAPACADLPGSLEALDDTHLCAEAAGTESSVRIDKLENGVPYHLVLVAVDPSRNPLAIDLGVHEPSPVQDFWEDYKDSGGRAEGGCSAASDGSGGLYVVLAIILALSMVRTLRKRKRRTRLVLSGLVLFCSVGWTSAASAQPWWETTDEPLQAEVGDAKANWSFELKFGPYVPDVDSEFNLSGDAIGPFERMYGDGPFLASGMTLDRYFLHPAGQLGITGSIGFLTKSARAYRVDDSGQVLLDGDGNPLRAEGDSNTFRLIPMMLGVVYRLTVLDDKLGVPVIPYGRLGLSYYYWWVSPPGGGVAEVPTASCPDLTADCDGDVAKGGSLGWQGSLGLAFRLERLDPDAEVALRTELGIEHAGLLVEMTYADVSGFGADNKLSVGDFTWFGGINFEF